VHRLRAIRGCLQSFWRGRVSDDHATQAAEDCRRPRLRTGPAAHARGAKCVAPCHSSQSCYSSQSCHSSKSCHSSQSRPFAVACMDMERMMRRSDGQAACVWACHRAHSVAKSVCKRWCWECVKGRPGLLPWARGACSPPSPPPSTPGPALLPVRHRVVACVAWHAWRPILHSESGWHVGVAPAQGGRRAATTLWHALLARPQHLGGSGGRLCRVRPRVVRPG
jgi:hypothetical protein